MMFSDRDSNYPQPAFGKWWLSQFRRWGMVKGDAGLRRHRRRRCCGRTSICEAMKDMGVTKKVAEIQKFTFCDGVTFDAGRSGEIRDVVRCA